MTDYKDNKVNDINLKDWKNEKYKDILTDSLWIMNERDRSGVHNASYHGNFIPQIPNQLIRRYTKPGDWVLDPFMGCGTTLIEAKKLGRNAVGIELQKDVVNKALELLINQPSDYDVKSRILHNNCVSEGFEDTMIDCSINYINLIILHPPYWDIIRFSDDDNDLSNATSLDHFLSSLTFVAYYYSQFLAVGGHIALVISDIYKDSEWIPLAFKAMNDILIHPHLKVKLKSIVVKNFNRTKAKANQENLWRYRALVGGFYLFKHEYIFIFKKEKQ